jgi:glycosyltransferase involved in cell wall biosynthesis
VKRTLIAHVIFPRRSLLRPVPEFAWEAVQALARTDDLDVDVLMPLPIAQARQLQKKWPSGIEARLLQLVPQPTLIPYLPIPRRSTESATAAIATHLMRRPRAGRPRVLHGSFLDEGGFAAAMAARVLDAPSIVVAHGSDVRAARGLVEGIGRKKRALKSIAHAKAVLAVSNHLAQELALLGARAEVLPFTASAQLFPEAPRANRDRPLILFVGRLTREKGVDLLLEALARMENQSARLELVGADPGQLDLRGMIARLGLSDRVSIAGELELAELPARYAACSLLALPSRSEGLPCVVAEALLSGRPVVASDVGGVSEVVDDGVGRLVPSEDVARLSAALDDVLREDYDPRALRARALPATWERTGPRLAAITRALL